MGEWLGERLDEESDVSQRLALRFVCRHRSRLWQETGGRSVNERFVSAGLRLMRWMK